MKNLFNIIVPTYNRYKELAEFFKRNEASRAPRQLGQQKQNAVIFDIGAHCEFIATQLAQALEDQQPTIYSFELVPPTFSDLVSSIHELGLKHVISPIPQALSDQAGFTAHKSLKMPGKDLRGKFRGLLHILK